VIALALRLFDVVLDVLPDACFRSDARDSWSVLS
jgi:hypothetical protein